MRDYINECLTVVLAFFATCAKPDEEMEKCAQLRREGIYTEDYARKVNIEQNNRILGAKYVAEACLEDFREQFNKALKAWDAPKMTEMQCDDYKLLDAGFPLTLEEYRALCERNEANATVLRKAVEYGNQGGRNWAPYAMKYYKPAKERRAAFDHVLQVAHNMLDYEPECRRDSLETHRAFWVAATSADRAVIGAVNNI